MKKLQKIALVILIISSIYLLTYNSYASDIWQQGKDFLNKGENKTGILDFSTAEDGIVKLVDFLLGIGTMVIFITTIVLGIRYMLVNPNEKSRIKQATTPWILGVVIIFGALTIWKLMIQIFGGSLGG